MGPNILKYEKQYSIGVNHEGPTLEQIKENALNRVLDLEPILTRAVSHYDHLVEFDPKSDPPKLRWKTWLLKESSIEYLVSISTILGKVLEEQKRTY